MTKSPACSRACSAAPLILGKTAEPEIKHEPKPIDQQRTAREQESERAREQSVDDLARRRQDWTRQWQETAPERMTDDDIERRQQRERDDDRGRSR